VGQQINDFKMAFIGGSLTDSYDFLQSFAANSPENDID
jgi:hypothetical protein